MTATQHETGPPRRPFWELDRELTRRLLTLAYPVVLAMLTQTAINLLDTIMVGRLPKQYSIAGQSAIGYSLILLWGVGGFLSSFVVGTQAITARRFGEGDHEGAGRTMTNSLLLTVSSALVAAWAAHAAIGHIFPFFNSNADVLRLGIPYAQWRMLGVFPMVVTVSFKGFFDGIGFTKAHMYAAILMNICNVVLNYILIFGALGFEPMYVEGAGLASAISSLLGMLLMFGFACAPEFRRKYKYFRLSAIRRRLLWEITRISIPSGLATTFVMTGFALFLKIVGILDERVVTEAITQAGFWHGGDIPLQRALEAQPLLGDLYLSAMHARPPIFVAATKVIIDILSVTFMTCIAFGTATATLVGQSLGARRPDLAERYGWESVRIGVYLMGFMGLIAIAFPDLLFAVFSKDMEVVDAGRASLRLMGGCEALVGVAMILAQALYGAGNSAYVMKVELFLHVTCLVPLAYVLGVVLDLGLVGIWASAFTYICLMASAMIWKFWRGDWKDIRL
ncbi:MAG: MATE family efflux transporter [Deltaproteobacteria bacterium]|nr:MATE family efflux transporter [Burkholderiaceae bacterium]MCB9729526.1 MATE family efflux transporter [Deltaproteobacteria bacterium]MCB9786733.1 MATE family efflux transporter [Deltaproteobacteria bacterium]